jgi:signal transduction histidine kinase
MASGREEDIAGGDGAHAVVRLDPECPVQVEPLIRAAAGHWSDALEARNLTFSTENLDALPAIMADPKRLGQVFEELIQNAIKFTPDGGGIKVRGLLREGAQGSRTVELVIADTGVGVAAGDRARIFEPYFRRGEVVLHGAGRTQFGAAGPGLGLSRALTIVKAHGGRIWAESPGYDKGNCPGTEIHLVLPVRPGGSPAQ